jgi:hypothetical protein
MIIENSEIGYLHDKTPKSAHSGKVFSPCVWGVEIFKTDTFTYTHSHFTR